MRFRCLGREFMATVNRHCGNADADAGGFAGCTLRYIMEADGDVTLCLACVKEHSLSSSGLFHGEGKTPRGQINHLWAISAQTNNLSSIRPLSLQ